MISSALESNCFYLPYNDPEFGEYHAIERRLEIQENPFQQNRKKHGYIRINDKTPLVIRLPPGEALHFEAAPMRIPDASDDLWVWEGFHPRRLATCPEDDELPSQFEFAAAEAYEISMTIPSTWTYVGLLSDGRTITFTGSQFGFALVRKMERARIQLDNKQIELIYRSTDFLKLLPIIKRTMQKYPEWFGPYPFSNISILEADVLDISGIPGLVLFNKPRQAAFESIQVDWLNWSHWVIASLIGRQWLGANMPARQLRDDWLFRGTIEFVTLQILQESSVRFNIFNSVETGLAAIDFNYRELQDLGAAVLFQDEPEFVLTNENLETKVPLDKQHSQVSLRQALALRYAGAQVGVSNGQQILRGAIQGLSSTSVTPKNFLAAIQSQGQLGSKFASSLLSFWQSPGWVDFDITEFTYEESESGFHTLVRVDQRGSLNLNANVTITDSSGHEVVVPLASNENELQARATLPDRPSKVEVDAERHHFDSNRFNNTNRWPRLKFFPGNARGLPDDELTVIWALYPFRRPGQPWSLALNTGLLRYINASTFGTLETEIGGKHRSAFSISESYKLPALSLSGSAAIEQNLFGSRVISKEIKYGPLLSTGPRIDFQTAFRHRQVVGKPASGHQTIGGGSTIQHRGQIRHFGYKVTGEYELAPEAWSPEFQYDRRFGIVELYASIPSWMDYQLRLFRGEYTYSGEVPEELLFHPEDLKLARLRLDVPNLPRSAKIFSIGNDLFLPFSWDQAGGTVLLNRRLRWRLFYDYGRALDLAQEFRAAGGGILIPFGGDIAGVGTLALTRFNLIVVGYSSADGEVSTKPRFLFTFGADL